MSSTNIDYQIIHYQGDTYVLEFSYLDDDNTPIDLAGFSADMFIKRSPGINKLVCQVKDMYPTGSFGRSGDVDFLYNQGFTGETGGIILNYNGTVGAVYILIDDKTVSGMPAGRHFYDLVITNQSNNEVKTILNGTFELAKEVTS